MTEEKNAGAPEELDLSEQRRIRRAKLKELQDAGQDPFQITKYIVTAHSADVKEKFDEMDGPTWNCIVGHNFMANVKHIAERFAYFYIDQLGFLLFKAQ